MQTHSHCTGENAKEMEIDEHQTWLPGETMESSLQKKPGTILSASETPLLLVWVTLTYYSQFSTIFRFIKQVFQYSMLLNFLLFGWQFILFMITTVC